MKRFVDVHTGEVMAGQGEVVLKSDTNGGCLVIVAYDKLHKIGALAHAMFLSEQQRKNCRKMRDAAAAINEMLEDMSLLGATANDIEVSLVAGENIPHEKDDPEYNHNIESTFNLLQQRHIKIREMASADPGTAHIALDVESGDILYE